jgi:lipopolysaccharide export system protein LptA
MSVKLSLPRAFRHPAEPLCQGTAMKPSLLATVTAALSLSAGTLLTSGTAHAVTVLTVQPGASIQAAVDAAQPGDTIAVSAGTYHESVLVEKDNISIRGAGSGTGGTVLLPPTTFPADNCGDRRAAVCFHGAVDGTDGPTSHATAFNKGGHLSGFRISGFTVDVSLSATDGADVSGVVLTDSGSYGLTDTVSKNTVVENSEFDRAGRAAIYVGNYNIPQANAVIRANVVTDGAYGISAYDTSGVKVTGNTVHASCAGFFGFSDSYRVPGGDFLSVTKNNFTGNNVNCPGEYGFPEAVQGSGIILAGSSHATVTGNVVTGNSGPDPLSGGVVVVSSRKYDAAETEDEGAISLSGNVVQNNGPADVVWDGSGTGVSLSGNVCGTSSPAGLC